MPQSKILINSSYLYAFFDKTNKQHAAAVLVADLYQSQFVIVSVILTEVA